MPSRVGTLDVLKLAVYTRADGSIYFNEDGKRYPVHGNTRWTTTDRVKMRGDHALTTNPPTSDLHNSVQVEASLGNREQDELELAIAASLRDLDDNSHSTVLQVEDNNNSLSCVVCLTAPVDHMIRACNHACVCAACARRLDDCPICREPIARIERIWLP